MLALGFETQLDELHTWLPPGRQLLLFTATFPLKLREASKRYAGRADHEVTIRIDALRIADARARAKDSANDAGEQRKASLTGAQTHAHTRARETHAPFWRGGHAKLKLFSLSLRDATRRDAALTPGSRVRSRGQKDRARRGG